MGQAASSPGSLHPTSHSGSGNSSCLRRSLPRLNRGAGRGAAAPAHPGCRSEGWGVSNAVILPLFEYLHISFNETGGFFKK